MNIIITLIPLCLEDKRRKVVISNFDDSGKGGNDDDFSYAGAVSRPWQPDERAGRKPLYRNLAPAGESLPRPQAIVAVSAHWYTRGTAVTAMEQPKTIHDFGGFPQALFDTQYPAPGSPELAARLQQLLAPTPVLADRETWGLDHGSWGVLIKMYPQADIPVVQLSIDGTQPAQYHYALGRKLAALREQG